MTLDLFTHAESRRYPEVPGAKASGTSAEAAARIEPAAETLRRRCLAVLRRRNLTADEVAEWVGESILAVRPRISELKAQGLVEKTAQRRANASGMSAVVWRICK